MSRGEETRLREALEKEHRTHQRQQLLKRLWRLQRGEPSLSEFKRSAVAQQLPTGADSSVLAVVSNALA